MFLSAHCYVTEAAAAPLGLQWEIEGEHLPEKYTVDSETKITMKGGTGDLYENYNTAQNIFLTSIPSSGDYEFRTRLTFRPTKNYQAAGLIVYLDDDNYLALLRRYHSSYHSEKSIIQLITEKGGNCEEDGRIGDDEDKYKDEIHLKIQKSGGEYNAFVSADGQSWDPVMTRVNANVTNSHASASPPRIGFFSKGFPDSDADLVWQDFTVDGTVIPYTAWSQTPYTLTYNYNGGSSGISTAPVTGGTIVDLNPAAVPAQRPGWTFVGWNRDNAAKTAINSFIMPNHDEEVFAIYKKELIELVSPGKNIRVTVKMTDAGIVTYSASLNGTPMILDSALGIDITGYADFTSGLAYKPEKTKTNAINETYNMISGKFSQYVNKANELVLTFEKDSREIQFVFRAYDDGVAFRYVIDGSGNYSAGTAAKAGEITEFQLIPGSRVWAMPYKTNYNNAYREYTFGQLITWQDDLNNWQSGVGMPVLVKIDDSKWMNIAQGQLNSDYCGVKLKGYKDGLLKVALTQSQTDPVNIKLPFKSPWRVAVMGTPAKIAETMIFENLCEPRQLPDTSWIKPGFSAWSWTAQLRLGSQYEGQADKNVHIEYIDLAAKMGWPYYTMDAGWRIMSYTDIVNIIEYAHDQGVGIWAWLRIDELATSEMCETALSKIKDLKIVGIKVDFVWEERQTHIITPPPGDWHGSLKHIDFIAETAAKYKLMVSFSNAHPPTGERRTYPHILSFDANRNAEFYVHKSGIANSAQQNTIHPFARNATGPMYYSPFVSASWTRGTAEGENGRVTAAHNIALVVLFERGYETLSDEPDIYMNSGFSDFFRNLPSTWDESRMLDGVPGQYAVMARRSGDDWYVAAVTNEKRTIALNMSFLGNGSYYKALICGDGATDDDVAVETKLIKKSDTVSLSMRQFGGAAIKITKTQSTYPVKPFDDMKYYPNPIRPSKGLNYAKMNFTNMPAGTRIKIYTMLGRVVRELKADASGMAVWDGKNNAGEKAASGVYIVYMEDGDGNKKRIKVAVER